MIHDAFFWTFLVESAGYIAICALIARAVFLLRKPAAKTFTPVQPGSLRERMQQSTALQTTPSMGAEAKNGWVDTPPDVGRWRGYSESLPATAYGDNPQRAKERYIERISELQTGIAEALEANDIEVLRRKDLVKPKDWIGVRLAENSEVAETPALPPPVD